MHKREKPSAPRRLRAELSKADNDDVDGGERVSPALDRAADQVVQRATRGLMRVNSQRRMRSFFRKLLAAVIVVGVIAGLYYWFGDDLPLDVLSEYWEQLKTKLLLPISESPSPSS